MPKGPTKPRTPSGPQTPKSRTTPSAIDPGSDGRSGPGLETDGCDAVRRDADMHSEEISAGRMGGGADSGRPGQCAGMARRGETPVVGIGMLT
jgi:hypothetical protein